MTDVYRLATVNDAERLLDLTLRAYEPIRKLNIPFTAATATLDVVLDNIKNSHCYVLERDGLIIATITHREIESITKWPFLWWFAVEPNEKSKGVGSKLLKWVEEEVVRDQLGEPAVTLATSTRHPWLVSMYERKGYVCFYEVQSEQDDIVFLRKVLIPHLYERQKGERELVKIEQ